MQKQQGVRRRRPLRAVQRPGPAAIGVLQASNAAPHPSVATLARSVERIELRGFGVFNVRPRKTGIGRNPRTGAEVSIPPGKAVRFKPGKELQSID